MTELTKDLDDSRVDSLYKWVAQGKLGITGPVSGTTKRLIEEHFIEQVRSLLKECGQHSSPIRLEPLARARRIETEEAKSGPEGILMPVGAGFRVILRRSPPRRMRFTLAHEIAHTFFYDFDASPPRPAYEPVLSRPWVEEDLCRRMAREMLMPREMLETFLHREQLRSPSFLALHKITERFDVSIQAATMRIQDLNLWDALFIFSRVDLLDSNADLRSKCKVIGSGRYRIRGIGAEIGHTPVFLDHLREVREKRVGSCRLAVRKAHQQLHIESHLLAREILSICSGLTVYNSRSQEEQSVLETSV